MSKNVSGLVNALKQFINEAILDSDDVAAAMAALRRSGKCPVFTVDITLEDGKEPIAELPEPMRAPEELSLTDSDVDFLAAIGITEAASCGTESAGRE